MRILLDTPLLISDPENAVFVSAVSLWEIWLKESLGKLRLPAGFERKLTAAQTRYVARLPWHHRDPFDRMLAAQACAENLILLTADRALAVYGDFVQLVR